MICKIDTVFAQIQPETKIANRPIGLKLRTEGNNENFPQPYQVGQFYYLVKHLIIRT